MPIEELGKTLTVVASNDKPSLVMLFTALASGLVGSIRRATLLKEKMSWCGMFKYIFSPIFIFGLFTAILAGMTVGEVVRFFGGDFQQVQVATAVGAWFGDKVFHAIETYTYIVMGNDRRVKDKDKDQEVE